MDFTLGNLAAPPFANIVVVINDNVVCSGGYNGIDPLFKEEFSIFGKWFGFSLKSYYLASPHGLRWALLVVATISLALCY